MPDIIDTVEELRKEIDDWIKFNPDADNTNVTKHIFQHILNIPPFNGESTAPSSFEIEEFDENGNAFDPPTFATVKVFRNADGSNGGELLEVTTSTNQKIGIS